MQIKGNTLNLQITLTNSNLMHNVNTITDIIVDQSTIKISRKHIKN